jgi:hypothetical protein
MSRGVNETGTVVHAVSVLDVFPTSSVALTFTQTVLPGDTRSVSAARFVCLYSWWKSRSSPWKPMPVESCGNESTITSNDFAVESLNHWA